MPDLCILPPSSLQNFEFIQSRFYCLTR